MQVQHFFHWHQDSCKPFSSEKNYNLVIVFFVPISKSTLRRAFKMRLSVNNAVIYRKKTTYGLWKMEKRCGLPFSTQKNGERFLASLMERERSSRTSLSRKIVLHQLMRVSCTQCSKNTAVSPFLLLSDDVLVYVR